MKALWLRLAMCVPMYLFEHHLACDLVSFCKIYQGHSEVSFCVLLHFQKISGNLMTVVLQEKNRQENWFETTFHSSGYVAKALSYLQTKMSSI